MQFHVTTQSTNTYAESVQGTAYVCAQGCAAFIKLTKLMHVVIDPGDATG